MRVMCAHFIDEQTERADDVVLMLQAHDSSFSMKIV